MANEIFSARTGNKSTTKPIYIVVVEDPENSKKALYFKGAEIIRHPSFIDIRGFVLTKKQAEELVKNPNAENASLEPINIEIPWQKIYSITNITYKKQRTE